MSERFDKELRRALLTVDPGAEFTAEVMRRVEKERPTTSIERRTRTWRWVPLALAASVIAAVGIVQERERREEARGLRARQELLAALQLTSAKLNLAYRAVENQPVIEIDERN
jgi:anti-sigma-K factor RskA